MHPRHYFSQTLAVLISLAATLSPRLQAANAKYFVVLTGQPLASIGAPSGRLATPAAATRLAQMTREQDTWAAVIDRHGGRVLNRFHLLSHSLFVELAPAEAEALRNQPGIAAVVPERHYQRQLLTSVPFAGGTRAWSGNHVAGATNATGKGIRIGIIDSGIDYYHAMFGGAGSAAEYLADDPTTIEGNSFPTAKVVGGTDFVGDDYDSGGLGDAATPAPDPDPLDPAANGHGSHVAGIAAGGGVLADGSAYRGPYTDALDRSNFKVGPGMAPEAVLYALKVFGASGSTSSSIIVKALEWAADPNGDNDTSDHLDVVNLSLGTDFGDDSADDPELAGVERLVALGCVVAISAGNGGDIAYKVANPSTAPRAISVANCVDNGFATAGIRVNAPAPVAGTYASQEGAFTAQLASIPPVQAQVVIALPLLACDPLSNASALNGKLALIDRGTCFFSDKVRHAQAAGAIGVVMVNNVDGPPIIMSGTGDTSDIKIPGVMISKADGDRLRAQVPNGLELTLSADVTFVHPELADTVEEASSRGPAWRRSHLKPDLAAPGAAIFSTRAGSGSEGMEESGTSMSSPHVAGAAALVKQVHPGWSPEEIKAVLMNTAVTPLHTVSGAPYSESRAGAGRLAVDQAIRSPVTVRAENDGGAVSLSFGQIFASGPVTLDSAVILANHGDLPLTFRIAASNTLDNPGVRLVPAVTEIRVPAQGTARLAVQLKLEPSLLRADPDQTSDDTIASVPRWAMPEGTGELWFYGGPVDVHLPWYSVPRAITPHAATTLNQGTPPGDSFTARFPTRGAGGPIRPLVGVFQLGATNSTHHFGDFRDATDLIATGAASDYATAQSLARTRIFFALTTAGAWPTPQRYYQDLEIEIDRNGDGVADVVLANNNQGSVSFGALEDYGDANDAFITAVDQLDGSPLVTGGVWNALPPNIADTAPFQNAMLVHSATGEQLGLKSASPSFAYRAVTRGDFSDKTDWVRFDPTHPIVDATGFGLEHTPWLEEGLTVSAVVNRTNALAAGTPATGLVPVLLVHAHGQPGAQSDIIYLNLGTEDLDADGLPDDWELAFLGDLNDGPDSDRDHDGFSAAQERAAGTNPADPHSLLALIPPTAPGDPIRWQSVVGKSYAIRRSPSVDGPYTVWRSGITATETTSSVVDPDLNARPQSFFYRVELMP